MSSAAATALKNAAAMMDNAKTALNAVQGIENSEIRGLHKFILDIRLCNNHEQEQARVDKEMANIRSKFASNTSLSSYNKKKYVWKLIYMFMLGYEVDFGHMEMIALISSPKFSEKNVGYIAVSLLVRPGDEMMTLVINTMRNDLTSHSNPAQALALSSMANLGSADLACALFPDVQKLLFGSSTDSYVRKKAALCCLRFFRDAPDLVSHDDWAEKMASLLEDKHLGVVTSVMALLLAYAARKPLAYESLVPYVIHLLSRLVIHKTTHPSYKYYGTACPWLQVKLLKFLQLYPSPADRSNLNKALEIILTRTELSESVSKTNADYCVLFEAINLIIHHSALSQSANSLSPPTSRGTSPAPGGSGVSEADGGQGGPGGRTGDVGALREKAMTRLGAFIGSGDSPNPHDPNIRYLGLETMSRLARLEGGNRSIKQHQPTVIASLKDADVSVCRRALDVLFVMCDAENAVGIVEDLMDHLVVSDPIVREEMVQKIAILAERYQDDLTWYVDKMLNMISIAGDFVSHDVWYRIIQIVTNHKDLQAYAAERLYNALLGGSVHETAVSVGGYILGEFGYFIVEQVSGVEQFRVLHSHFNKSSNSTKALLLSTYIKLSNLYPECVAETRPVFEKYSVSTDLELQQRACEYLALPGIENGELMEEVLKEMPKFNENRESAPEAAVRKHHEAREKGAGAAVDEEEEEQEEQADTPPPPPAVVSDLLGVDDDDSGAMNGGGGGMSDDYGSMGAFNAGGASVAPVGVSPSMVPELKRLFNAACMSTKGVLLETDCYRLGHVHQYIGSLGKIVLYHMNKSGSTMEDFKVVIPAVDYLGSLSMQDVASEIGAKVQVVQEVRCECMKPYAGAPEVSVSFTLGGVPHCYDLRLPVVASCFVQPMALPVDEFNKRWGLLTGENREQMCDVPNPAAASPNAAAVMNAVSSIMQTGMHLGMSTPDALGLEMMSPNVAMGAGTLQTGLMGPTGQKISVGVMMRVEVDSMNQGFRVVVRAVHGSVAEALNNIVRVQLASLAV